jgi:hypothetical protein
MLGSSLVAAQLAASREGPNSMSEWVSEWFIINETWLLNFWAYLRDVSESFAQCSANRAQFQKSCNWLSWCVPRLLTPRAREVRRVGHRGRRQHAICHSWWLSDVIWNVFEAEDMANISVLSELAIVKESKWDGWLPHFRLNVKCLFDLEKLGRWYAVTSVPLFVSCYAYHYCLSEARISSKQHLKIQRFCINISSQITCLVTAYVNVHYVRNATASVV